MNLVTNLEDALKRAGIQSKTTYEPDDDYFPTVHVGEFGIGVDGSCLNVGLGPYSVTHPAEVDEDGEESWEQSPLMMKAEDVVEYLRKVGACS
jgi:hypothetical protein